MSDISRSTIHIRIFGDNLDPEYVTQRLGCSPSSAAKTGEKLIRPNGKTRMVDKGFWILDYGESDNVILDEKIELLLGKLTDNLDIWQEITESAEVADISCGLFIDEWNEGFTLSAHIVKKISDRNLEIGFDIYSPTESWDLIRKRNEALDEQK